MSFYQEQTEKKELMAGPVGDQLRGYVKNIVAFGAFVDCNVGSDCLLHKSEFKGRNLAMNQQLDLKVKSVEKRGKTWRIGVALS